MDPAATTFLFCDGQLLVRAGGLEPAAPAEFLKEWSPPREIVDSFAVRPQGFTAMGLSGPADPPPPAFA